MRTILGSVYRRQYILRTGNVENFITFWILRVYYAHGPLKPKYVINPLTPNDLYVSRTTPLTSKRYILYIYSTNVGTEYFKYALYSPFFLFKMKFVS